MSDDAAIPDGNAPDVTAAELALGLLDGEERAAALRRTLADRGFAAEVEQWRTHFAQLFDLWPEAAVPGDIAGRIERSLSPTPPARYWGWPVIAALTSAAAAVLLVINVTRSPPTPVTPPAAITPAHMLAASIQPVAKGAPVMAIYEPATGMMRVGGTAAPGEGHAAQLWVIAGKTPPQSLGLLTTDAERMPVAMPMRAMLASGATLAISIEPRGGSPTGRPTGPVIASGTLGIV